MSFSTSTDEIIHNPMSMFKIITGTKEIVVLHAKKNLLKDLVE